MSLDRMTKISVKTLNALSGLVLKEWTPDKEGFRRLNVVDGYLEAVSLSTLTRLRLGDSLRDLPPRCQFLPYGFEPDCSDVKYKVPKRGRATSIKLLPILPDMPQYDDTGFVSVVGAERKAADFKIELPTMALPAISNFCRSWQRFGFDRPTERAISLFLSAGELVFLQRWQGASRIHALCLHDAEPIGNQFLCCVMADQLAAIADLLMEILWGHQEFITLSCAAPAGWNGGYNPEPTAGVRSPLEFTAAISEDDDQPFSEALIQLSPLFLTPESISGLNSPKFPVKAGGAKPNMHRSQPSKAGLKGSSALHYGSGEP